MAFLGYEFMLTKISDNLFDHVSEHAFAVLWVQEREELLFIQQLVCWRVVCLEPAILQALQNLLSCGEAMFYLYH